MALIRNPARAYRNAREAFRVWNGWRKARKERKQDSPPGIPEASDEFWDWTATETEDRIMHGKLTYTMVLALAVQALAAVVGIDVAPAELDAIAVGAATAGALYGRWRATRKAA